MFKHYHQKKFGQHFLKDKKIISKIISEINPKENQNLIEIGPGFGVLTTELLPIVKKMHAIEIDRNLISKLQNSFKDLGELIIHNEDALNFDFSNLFISQKKLRIVGNLPYNISTPLLFHLFKYYSIIEDMHFMLQKEVADRIVSKIGTKDYGRLSIMTQFYSNTQILFTVPPEAFYPKPKVNSAFVRLIPHKTLPYSIKNIESLSNIVKHAFMKRRKTLSNALKNIITEKNLINLGIDPKKRPEQISLKEYIDIANIK